MHLSGLGYFGELRGHALGGIELVFREQELKILFEYGGGFGNCFAPDIVRAVAKGPAEAKHGGEIPRLTDLESFVRPVPGLLRVVPAHVKAGQIPAGEKPAVQLSGTEQGALSGGHIPVQFGLQAELQPNGGIERAGLDGLPENWGGVLAFAHFEVGQAQEMAGVSGSKVRGALEIVDGIGVGEVIGGGEADAPIGGEAEGDSGN